MNKINLLGKRFGRLLVISADITIDGFAMWLCKCDCGITKSIRASSLMHKKQISCSCSKRDNGYENVCPVENKRFGALVVIEKENDAKKKYEWLCKCDCGNEKKIKSSHLIRGEITTCGCRINKITAQDPKLASAKPIWRRHYKDGGITFEEFIELSQLNCYYCKSPPINCQNSFTRRRARAKKNGSKKSTSGKFAVEKGNFIYNGLNRINNSLPHTINNVVPCCKHCNRAKLEMTADEFQKWLKRTAAHHIFEMTVEELEMAIEMWKNRI